MANEIVLPAYVDAVTEEGNKAVFEIGGLHPGYGHTIGNSLRRVLLSSLEGSSVVSVKMEGVNHEFSTIPGIAEDVITILLNIKQVRFRLFGDEPQVAHISVRGAKEVTAADIQTPSQLEIVDSSIHIATLGSKDAVFEVEIVVDKGLGYVPRESHRKEKVNVGELMLDAVYSPVRRVNYEVENMRVGDRTDYNKLRLFIETDGTISPRESLSSSLEILVNQLNAITRLTRKETTTEELTEQQSSPEIQTEGSASQVDYLKKPIELLELSPRSQAALERAGINIIGDLMALKPDEIKAIPGVGAVSLREVRRAVGRFGLILGE